MNPDRVLKPVRVFLSSVLFFTFSINHAFSTEPTISEDRLNDFAKSKLWIRAIHYKSGIFGGVTSEIDGKNFFLSTVGKTNPLEELKSTIEAFKSNRKITYTNEMSPVSCIFPYRMRILEEKFGLKFERQKCEKYDEWVKTVRGDSISLIFSSYYTGVPASMFGHTFFRINLSAKKEHPLLNHALNYSAIVGHDSAVTQPLKGLFGFYPGKYSVVPYYVKVKEYNNYDQRDLYEYTLNLSQLEIDILLEHTWELANSYADYYFLTENCSYQLLTLLEVAKQDWDLSDRFPTHAIPADTVKAVVRQKDGLKSLTFRPSLYTRFNYKYDRLTDNGKDEYFKVMNRELPPEKVSSVDLIDTLNVQFLMKQNEQHGELDASDSELFRKLLIQRSKLPTLQDPDANEPKMIDRPDVSHESAMVGFGLKKLNSDFIQELRFRPALHDMMAPDKGYPAFSDLEVATLRLRYNYHSKEIVLKEATPMRVTALRPLTRLEKKPSYQAELGTIVPNDQYCSNCNVVSAKIGAGVTLGFFDQKLYLMSLMLFDYEGGKAFGERGHRFGPTLRSGLIGSFINNTKTKFEYIYKLPVFGKRAKSSELNFAQAIALGLQNELRLTASLVKSGDVRNKEFSVEALFYY